MPSIVSPAAILTAAAALSLAGAAQAQTFTGPKSPYYLAGDQYNGNIYVVQGTSLTRTFPEVYNSGSESILAVTNVVTTNGFGYYSGETGTAGQYTLAGVSTGVSHSYQAPPGEQWSLTFDGTSDGYYNYAVETSAFNGTGVVAHVIQYDRNWQNPKNFVRG